MRNQDSQIYSILSSNCSEYITVCNAAMIELNSLSIMSGYKENMIWHTSFSAILINEIKESF